jgi:5S rRNA maturation endonuclease (ribonuclease M5)
VTKLRVDLSELSMSAEQRQILAPYFASTKTNADGWLKMHCPIHGDASPSAGVNVMTGWWVCHTCGERGTIARLIARQHEWKPPDYGRIIGEDSEWAPTGMVVKTPLPEESLPRTRDLEEYSQRLLTNTNYRDPLEYLAAERGIEPKTIERYKIGYRPRENGGDFILPMWYDGALVNVRYYNPTRTPKVLNHTGYGSIGLFPDNDIPEHAKLVIVEGEWDCFATMQHLEKYGYTVRTFTNGTGAIRKLYSDNMAIKRIIASEPKEVITIFDCDEPGRAAAAHLSRLLPTKDVLLPYPVTGDGGKDLTDYWQERRGRPDEAERQLLDLVTDDTNERSGNERSQSLPEASPRRPGKRGQGVISAPVREARRPGRVVQGTEDLPAERPLCNSLHSALHDPIYDGQVIRLSNIVVLGFGSLYHMLATSGEVVGCTKKPSGLAQRVTRCSTCPKGDQETPPTWSIVLSGDLPLVEDLIGKGAENQFAMIHKYHSLCSAAVSKRTDTLTYRDMVIKEHGHNDEVAVQCFFVDPGLDIQPPKSYDLTCIVATLARDQTKTLLVIDATETVSAAPPKPSSLPRPTRETKASMVRWIMNIADMLALEHTGVFEQQLMHITIALTFTSPLKFLEGDRRHSVIRGTLDNTLVGVTRTGKTTTFKGIAKAFGLNGPRLDDAMVSGENVSMAGLLVGIDQILGQRVAIPGALARNHGGTVFIDEQQELAKNTETKKVMSALNSVRDTGRISMKKIKDVDYQAELGLITALNPSEDTKDRPIAAVPENYETPAERSRIDLAVAVLSVDTYMQQRIEEHLRERAASMPRMTQGEREWLAWFAKNVSPECIVVPRGGEFTRVLDQYCQGYEATFATEYDPIGVMHPQTNRARLLRLAACIAIFTGSLDAQYERVLVKLVHLEVAKWLIDKVNEESGYIELVTERRAEYELRQKAIAKAVQILTVSDSITAKRVLQNEDMKRKAKVFASRWNDADFYVDTGYVERGVWGPLKNLIDRFIEDGLLVPVKPGSNNYKMHPDFRKALGKALRQREEA